MATLQNIRSKGPLLVIVIGLALFAFIAGDAWKVMQPHQAHDVGEVNGDALSAQEYQNLVEEYTEVVKLMRGVNALNDEQTNQVRDEVWRSYVNNKLIEKEAKALGLTVSTAEIQDILKAGVHPLLRQTPFQNPQTGNFDKDMLNKFLVEYAKMNESQMPAQYAEQYNNMYKYWSFIQKTLIQSRLAEKYQALVAKALLSNPVEAQDAFDARVNQYNVLLAGIPYSSVVDSTIVVKESELKELYNKKKEQFKQYQETRDIKYIDVQVTASLIKHGYNIGLSGFTPAGTAKAVTAELAKIAEAEHAKGNPFQIGIFTGASTGDSCDGILSRAKAIRYRAPYTTNSDFRKAVNSGEIAYNDIHLSQMAQEVRYGFMGKVNIAIIEACEVTPDGKIYLTAAGGIAPTVCRLADQIIVELNAAHSKNAMGLHDVYEPLDPPYRREIPIYKPSDRIGQPYIQVDPKKIVGVVETNWPDEARSFAEADPLTDKIGQNVADFLAADMKRGIIPSTFLPLQSGVGNIANAVLGALGRDKTIPAFEMYTEVIQNSVIGLIRDGRVKFGSACSLTVTNDCLQGIYDDMDFFRDKLVLRPSEISNSPEVVRRLGVISINTAIEADLYGNVNSTHIGGTKMMNGIGGSGDFTRNAYISIFTCPSVAKEGKISAIVPMVSHHDHTEHDVNIIITEQGVADLRGKSPKERAQAIIENCVHPDYKNILWDYLKITDGKSQTPQAVRAALAMHAELAKSGDMKNVDWAQYK